MLDLPNLAAVGLGENRDRDGVNEQNNGQNIALKRASFLKIRAKHLLQLEQSKRDHFFMLILFGWAAAQVAS